MMLLKTKSKISKFLGKRSILLSSKSLTEASNLSHIVIALSKTYQKIGMQLITQGYLYILD